MLKVGIDALAFYTPHYYLDMRILANVRGVDSNKFYVGLGQHKMAVVAPDEDIVTMAANAASRAIKNVDLQTVSTILFATETGIDQSKAAGVYLKSLLGFPDRVRVVELKQACYSATAGLHFACALVARDPKQKVLLVASDISRYGLNTAGESSQGAGAVAMVISANPRVMTIDPEAGLHTDDVMDFWRPNYRSEALVEGHYSTKIYLDALEKTWAHYVEQTGRSYEDHDYFCYHTPVPRLVEKAHALLNTVAGNVLTKEDVEKAMAPALVYGRESGNSYSAALYISLVSLFDHVKEDMTGRRVGFYSYGSGCVAEFFSGEVQADYRAGLDTTYHQVMLSNRQALTYQEYEAFYLYSLPNNGGECRTPKHETGGFRLAGIKDHKRQYQIVADHHASKLSVSLDHPVIKALSPGKVILSGEHAVVYGKPVIAMAINRYTETTVSQSDTDQVNFNLLNFNYEDSFTLNTLRELKNRVKSQYKSFLAGKIGIREVIRQPFELTQYAVINWLDHINAKMSKGFAIRTQSNIPVGCGMGSSAASVLSVLKAVTRAQGDQWDKSRYYAVATEIEQMQHGKSSGVDVYTSLYGGCVYFKEGQAQSRPIPNMPFYIVNTGVPVTSTGEAVSQVAKQFANHPIWQTFEAVTQLMDEAIQRNDLLEVQAAIRDNHRLLVEIGVVPLRVQQFIQAIEAVGAAGKVSGAGAVEGDHAGAVLVVTENHEALAKLCHQYGYEFMPIQVDARGLHVE